MISSDDADNYPHVIAFYGSHGFLFKDGFVNVSIFNVKPYECWNIEALKIVWVSF